MLLQFTVKNHRSIHNAATLSMMHPNDNLSTPPLGASGIWGPNGSGKTNIIDALAWLSHAVRYSQHHRRPIPRSPFKAADGNMTSEFELDLRIDGKRYWYYLSIDDKQVQEEALWIFPTDTAEGESLFERTGPNIKLPEGFTSAIADRLATPTTLCLALPEYLPEEAAPAAQKLRDIQIVGFRDTYLADSCRKNHHLPSEDQIGCNYEHPRAGFYRTPAGWRDNEEAARQQRAKFVYEPSQMLKIFGPDSDTKTRRLAKQMLLSFDFGITDVVVTNETEVNHYHERVKLLRLLGGDSPFNGQPHYFELCEEADGVQTALDLISTIVEPFLNGGLIVWDNLGDGLHPMIVKEIIKLFSDESLNQNSSQLLFTSHQPSLMSQINREQIWLTDRTHEGGTRLIALTDYIQSSEHEDLTRKYMSGRFGGLPVTLSMTAAWEPGETDPLT